MTTERRPALTKPHPLTALSVAGANESPMPAQASPPPPASSPPPVEKKPSGQVNLRLDPELSKRVQRAEFALSARRGERVTKVALVEEALRDFLDRHQL